MYVKLMADVRAAIASGTFAEFRREFIAGFVPSQKILSQREAAKLER
jgi:queuine/archaeosine tRNA-ribosyltransferase